MSITKVEIDQLFNDDCKYYLNNPKLIFLSGGENDWRVQAVAEVEDERGAQPEVVGHRR